VDFDDEIGAAIEAPGKLWRQERRHLTGRPAEEMAISAREAPLISTRMFA
jgi:hypothetical protein